MVQGLRPASFDCAQDCGLHPWLHSGRPFRARGCDGVRYQGLRSSSCTPGYVLVAPFGALGLGCDTSPGVTVFDLHPWLHSGRPFRARVVMVFVTRGCGVRPSAALRTLSFDRFAKVARNLPCGRLLPSMASRPGLRRGIKTGSTFLPGDGLIWSKGLWGDRVRAHQESRESGGGRARRSVRSIRKDVFLFADKADKSLGPCGSGFRDGFSCSRWGLRVRGVERSG
jgi:hypothetical protein